MITHDGYTLLLIHTWILWVVPFAIALVFFLLGRATKHSQP